MNAPREGGGRRLAPTVFLVADDSSIGRALFAGLDLFFRVRLVSVPDCGCLEQSTRVLESVATHAMSAVEPVAVVLMDRARPASGHSGSVALEAALLICRNLHLPALAWTADVRRAASLRRALRPRRRVGESAIGQSLSALVRDIAWSVRLGDETESGEQEAIDAALEAGFAGSRRLLLHELRAGKPFPKSLLECAKEIHAKAVASQEHLQALERSWRDLQATFGGPLVGKRTADPVLYGLRATFIRLDVWIKSACERKAELALVVHEGPETLATITRAVESSIRQEP